ncbi:MAG: FtsX-like permease family protein, partial [Bacteroidota bacterium]
PQFNQIIGKSVSLSPFFSPVGIIFLIAFPFALGLLSGFYPALYLSSLGTTGVFQKLIIGRNKESLRHVLVLGQLLIAIILMAGTITVFRQMHYMANKPLGFDKQQLINIVNLPFSLEKIDAFREEVLKVGGVTNMAIASFPLDEIRSGSSLRVKNNPEGWVNMTHYDVDENFLQTTGIRLIAGRGLTVEDGNQKEKSNLKIVLNESGAKALGWLPHEAIDQPVFSAGFEGENWEVIGVVEDFNFSSLHRPVNPFIFSHESALSDITFRSATIRIEPREMSETLAGLEEVWKLFVPDQVFDYDFVDETMAQYYEAERLTGKLFTIFSGLGILICCLGLFGLMGFVVEKRAKEVGIRKVMGARSNQIVLLLSKDYLRLVVISSVLSIPVTWWGLNQWLDGFAYRVDNSIWVLMLAGLVVTLISWVTVAFYAYQAAQSNPVESLRTE